MTPKRAREMAYNVISARYCLWMSVSKPNECEALSWHQTAAYYTLKVPQKDWDKRVFDPATRVVERVRREVREESRRGNAV